jgi:hypothetical protein
VRRCPESGPRLLHTAEHIAGFLALAGAKPTAGRMRARRVVKIEELAASQRDFGLMSTAKLRSRLWPLKVPPRLGSAGRSPYHLLLFRYDIKIPRPLIAKLSKNEHYN